MNHKFIAVTALAMIGTAASAQDAAPQSVWAYFEGENGLLQAGVQTAEGQQLILKCEQRGDGTVAAVIYSPDRLKAPGVRPQPRPIRMRFDGGSSEIVTWPYFEQTAMALNTRREQQLPPFLVDLADANVLEVMLDPVDGGPIEINFQVAGARDAIARVYESCADGNNPLNQAP
jgi:hypothetical protein